MARITTIDCEQVVPNRFELVLAAAQRVRDLRRGEPPRVAPDHDKATVIALREIAAGAVDLERLWQRVLRPERVDVETDARGTGDTAVSSATAAAPTFRGGNLY